MSDLGRILVTLGLVLVGIGLVVLLFSRLNVPLGRLPGDITWKGKNWVVSFPLMTSLLASLLLTLIFWLISHFRR